MNYNIMITSQAEQDLRQIYEYISYDLLSPETAAEQIDRLQKNILNLSFLPYRFKQYDQDPWFSRGLHSMPVDNFQIFYIPDSNTLTVTILRIMHNLQNIPTELNSYTFYLK